MFLFNLVRPVFAHAWMLVDQCAMLRSSICAAAPCAGKQLRHPNNMSRCLLFLHRWKQLDDGWHRAWRSKNAMRQVCMKHNITSRKGNDTYFFTQAFTHRRFYIQTPLRFTRIFFTQKRIYTETLLHTDAFTQRRHTHTHMLRTILSYCELECVVHTKRAE